MKSVRETDRALAVVWRLALFTCLIASGISARAADLPKAGPTSNERLRKAAASRDLTLMDAALEAATADPKLSRSFELAMARAIVARERAIASRVSPRRDDLQRRLVIDKNSEWRYRKGNQAPPQGWNAREFDDSAWDVGRGSIGFGDADDKTRLDDMQSKYPTVFLRRRFEVAADDVVHVVALKLDVLFDDGYVAYLNGQEIHRVHAPGRRGQPIDHNATATSQHEATGYESVVLPASGLVAGSNTLALVGINYTIASGDFSIDPSLWSISRKGESSSQAWRVRVASARELVRVAGSRARTEEERRRVAIEQIALDLLSDDLDSARSGFATLEVAEASGVEVLRPVDYLRAIVAFRSGRFVEAGRLLVAGSYESNDPLARLDSHSLFLLARVHHELGEWAEAEQLYEKAVSRHDDSGRAAPGFPRLEARLRRGVALFQLGDSARAGKIFAEIAKTPDGPYLAECAELFRGVTLVHSREHGVAASQLLRLSQRTLDSELRARALLWAGRATARQFESAEAWYAGDLKSRTVDYFDQCGMISSNPRVRRQLDAARGAALLRFGDVEGALDVLVKASSGDSEAAARAMYRRIVALQNVGKLRESREICERFARLYPTSAFVPLFRLRHADAFFVSGLESSAEEIRTRRLDAAVDGYRSALDAGVLELEELTEARLGIALLLRGRFEAARRAFDAVDPDSLPADLAKSASDVVAVPYLRARLLLSTLDEKTRPRDARSAARLVRTLDRAEKLLVAFLGGGGASEPLRTRATIELASCLRRRGDLTADSRERARIFGRARGLVTATRQRLGRRPDAAGAYLEEARILVAMGDTSKAIQRYRSFVDEVPWKDSALAPGALVELAEVERGARKHVDALRALSLAKKLLSAGSEREEFEEVAARLARIRMQEARIGVELGEVATVASSLDQHLRGLHGVEAAVEAALLLREINPDVAFGVLEKHASRPGLLSADLRVDLLLALARRDFLEESAGIDEKLDQIVELVGPNDRRFADVRSLRSANLLSRGQYESAQRVLEVAYAEVVDSAIEDEILLRRAFCLLFTDPKAAARQFAEIERGGSSWTALSQLGRSVIARLGGAGGDAEQLAKAFVRSTRSNTRLVGGTFRDRSDERAARLARASTSETPTTTEQRAGVIARELLAWPLVSAERLNGSVPSFDSAGSSRLADFDSDVRELRLGPLPVGDVGASDPLDFVDWLWLEPSPPIVPVLEGPSRILLQLVEISESES